MRKFLFGVFHKITTKHLKVLVEGKKKTPKSVTPKDPTQVWRDSSSLFIFQEKLFEKHLVGAEVPFFTSNCYFCIFIRLLKQRGLILAVTDCKSKTKFQT